MLLLVLHYQVVEVKMTYGSGTGSQLLWHPPPQKSSLVPQNLPNIRELASPMIIGKICIYSLPIF